MNWISEAKQRLTDAGIDVTDIQYPLNGQRVMAVITSDGVVTKIPFVDVAIGHEVELYRKYRSGHGVWTRE